MKKSKNSSNIPKELEKLLIPLDILNPDPTNAKMHDERNIDAIKSSLSKFGQRSPIVVQKKGMIIRAGNARYEAAKQLGWTEIAAIVIDENNIDATAFAIADNRTADMANWDNEVLTKLVRELEKDIPEFIDDMKLNELMADIEKWDNQKNPYDEYIDMPEYEQNNLAVKEIIVRFKSKSDFEQFQKLLDRKITDGIKSIWYPANE